MRMNDDVYGVLAELLDQLERALNLLGEWSDQVPDANALASVQPFCYDTLSFPQWLQFVFVARMRQMIAGRQRLPGACGISPMVEEHFKGSHQDIEELLRVLAAIDRVLSS